MYLDKSDLFNNFIISLKENDTLLVCKLDRFARNTVHGVQTVQDLFERKVNVEILNMGRIDNTLTGNLILQVMLAFAEYERGMIVERTQSGKAVARLNPNFKEGRPQKFSEAQRKHAVDLLASSKTYNEVEKLTEISKSALICCKHQNGKHLEL